MVSVRQWPLVASANAAAPRRPPLPLVTVGIELETDTPDTKYFMLTASGDVLARVLPLVVHQNIRYKS